jgi:hypothetical protein
MHPHATWRSRNFWRPAEHEIKPYLGYLVASALALLDFSGRSCIVAILVATGWFLLVSE